MTIYLLCPLRSRATISPQLRTAPPLTLTLSRCLISRCSLLHPSPSAFAHSPGASASCALGLCAEGGGGRGASLVLRLVCGRAQWCRSWVEGTERGRWRSGGRGRGRAKQVGWGSKRAVVVWRGDVMTAPGSRHGANLMWEVRATVGSQRGHRATLAVNPAKFEIQ